jgi:hypothetical protein
VHTHTNTAIAKHTTTEINSAARSSQEHNNEQRRTTEARAMMRNRSSVVTDSFSVIGLLQRIIMARFQPDIPD